MYSLKEQTIFRFIITWPLQEYKAQKRKTRDEKIGSYIEKNMKQVETSSGEIQHLQQLVDGSGVQGSGNSRVKGSRFTHTEKLQFAQVNFDLTKHSKVSPAQRIM